MTVLAALQTAFPDQDFKAEEPLASYTTVRIGGPAEVFTRVSSSERLSALILFCIQENIQYTVLGWGANTLIADRGLRGLVIRNDSTQISVLEEVSADAAAVASSEAVAPRWASDDTTGSFKYDLKDLQYDERAENAPRVLVQMDSGVSLPMAINVLLAQGVTGLQWFARIPATVGGAIYNNIHGGQRFIGEFLHSVRVLNPDGSTATLTPDQLELGYDYSRFHTSQEVILSAQFVLFRGQVSEARTIATEWATRKKLQPQNSLGCVFQNITAEDQARLGVPTPSIGYLIEHTLKLKDLQAGAARVSPSHAAFIENTGGATATEYLEIIRQIVAAAREELAITLKPEIFFLGFTPEELAGIV